MGWSAHVIRQVVPTDPPPCRRRATYPGTGADCANDEPAVQRVLAATPRSASWWRAAENPREKPRGSCEGIRSSVERPGSGELPIAARRPAGTHRSIPVGAFWPGLE